MVFIMAAIRRLFDFHFLTVSRLKRRNLHQHTNFVEIDAVDEIEGFRYLSCWPPLSWVFKIQSFLTTAAVETHLHQLIDDGWRRGVMVSGVRQ